MLLCTERKCKDFSITQILREIKIGDSRNAKSAILTHLEALNLEFYEFLHFLKAEKQNSEPLKWKKTEILRQIKVGEFRVSNSAILTHLEALNLNVY